MVYKWCVVPQCKNTSIKSSQKLFVSVPTNPERRNMWLRLARRHPKSIKSHTNVFMCEDHFDMEKATTNYMKYKMGFSQKILLAHECVPTKFHCQEGRKRMSNAGSLRKMSHKKQRMDVDTDCLLNKNTTERIEPEELPKIRDKEAINDPITTVHKWLLVTTKVHMRHRSNVQTRCQNKSISTLPLKVRTDDESNTSKKPKKKSEPKKQYDPFQEFANDSTDEESDESAITDNGSERSAPVTEKVFVTCNSYEEEKSKTGSTTQQLGPTQAKRARLATSEIKINYTEEWYEFGKFVAEQLMCLDVEDARIAQAEIRDVLSKFDMNKIMQCKEEPTSSDIQPDTAEHSVVVTHKTIQVNPAESTATKSGSQTNTAGASQFVLSRVNIAGSSMNQLSGLVVNIAGQSENQSAPINYLVMPTTTQIANKERTSVTLRGAGTSVCSTVESRSSNMISAGTSVAQPGSSNMISAGTSVPLPGSSNLFSGTSVEQPGSSHMFSAATSVKTEPESKSSHSHIDVFMPREADKETFIMKFESNSDDETLI